MDSWLESFARANFVRSGDTAHDLKTPLNVAVLNLELLRIRVRKLTGGDDAVLAGHARAIDLELRRMASIIEAFFVLSTPPTDDGEPVAVDVCAVCNEAAARNGYEVRVEGRRIVRAHDARIRQAFKLFFDGAGSSADVSCNSHFRLTISGRPEGEDFELTRIFKFHYTDPLGNPDLSLATARLIAETYGGELDGREEEGGRVSIGISLPLGEE
jgi:hypothetical protein